MNIVLWILQGLLALAFLAAGAMKVFTPIDQLLANMAWIPESAEWLPRFIGASEILGGLGLILPAATRIKPILTPIAAAALAFVMLLAVGTHLALGETGALGAPIVLMLLSLFVAYGRAKLAPVQPRGEEAQQGSPEPAGAA